MSVLVPDPIPLDLPPGNPAALDDVAGSLTTAAFCLGVAGAALRGPAGTAPDWHGDDAAAAAARIATVTVLADEIAGALRTAASRLARHRECLLEVRGRIRALVAQQEDDVAAAWGRLGALSDPAFALRAGAPTATAVVEEFRAADAARGREHARLLAEVADDAAASARVLADCTHVLGGSGRPGDEWRVVAHLALVLPGWGDAELAARGTAFAAALLESPGRERRAADALALAGSPAFAGAFLVALGEENIGLLLAGLAADALDQDSPVALVLAAAFGAAVPGTGPADPVAAVLDAVYLRDDDPSVTADQTAAGMAAVLAAGAGSARRGLSPATVLSWTRQLLRYEHTQGIVAGVGAMPAGWDRPLHDPAAFALHLLVAEGDPALAAALLGDPDVWQVLLSRFMGDGTELDRLVVLAAREAGPAGDAAVRTGLEAVGSGLPEGPPQDRTVSRAVVDALAPTMGAAVAAHVRVAVDALWVAVDGRPEGRLDTVRGLGYIAVDPTAAAAVDDAVLGWSRDLVAEQGGAIGPGTPAPAVAVPSALLAVREYGHRLSYVLDEFEAQADAERKEIAWSYSVGLLGHVPGLAGEILGVLADYGALLLDRDGTWEAAVDDGPTVDGGTAGRESAGEFGTAHVAAATEVTRQAHVAFDRMANALGEPVPPVSPEKDWVAPIQDLSPFHPREADPHARRVPGHR